MTHCQHCGSQYQEGDNPRWCINCFRPWHQSRLGNCPGADGIKTGDITQADIDKLTAEIRAERDD